MNAPLRIIPQCDQVKGQLLHAGYLHAEGLYLDLYGFHDADDGYVVEAVAVTGTTVDISVLFHGRQMINMGYWLDLKDSGTPAQREAAERHRHEATRPC